MVTYTPPVHTGGKVGYVDEITILNKGSLPDTYDTGWHETARPELGQRILRVNFPRSQIIAYYNEGLIIIDPDDLLGGVGLFRFTPPHPLPPLMSSTGNVAAAVAQGVPQAGSLPITVHDVNNDPDLTQIEKENLIHYITDHPPDAVINTDLMDNFNAMTSQSAIVNDGDINGGYTSGTTVDVSHPDQREIGQNPPQDSGDIGNVMNVTKSLNTDQPFQGSSSITTDAPTDQVGSGGSGLGLLLLLLLAGGGL